MKGHFPEVTDAEHDQEFVALLTAHQGPVLAYVRSLMPGFSGASDILQQTNITLWKKKDHFEIGTNFKAWIFAIARFKVLEFRKQNARDSRLVFSEEMEEIFAAELPETAGDLDLRQQHLRECLQELKPAHRDLIQHRYQHRTPLRDYAESVGRSAGGLRVTLHRLRDTLAACIESKLASQA